MKRNFFLESISLARVFLRRNASMVVLDEAFSQIDQAKKRRILPELFSFIRKNNATLLMITHHIPIFSETNENFKILCNADFHVGEGIIDFAFSCNL